MIYAVTYGTHMYMHHKSWAGVGEVEAEADHLTLLPRGSTGKVNRGAMVYFTVPVDMGVSASGLVPDPGLMTVTVTITRDGIAPARRVTRTITGHTTAG